MKFLLKTALVASAIMVSSCAYAEDYYFSAALGSGSLDLKYKNNSFDSKNSKSINPGSLSLAIGSYFNEYLRGEVAANVLYGKTEGLFSSNKKNSTKLDATFYSYGAAANLYLDLPVSESFIPYVTTGVGVASNGVKVRNKDASTLLEKTSKSKFDFVWQAGAGFNVPLNDKTKFNFGYKYQQIGFDQKFAYRDTSQEALRVKADSAHLVQLGLQFDF
jgi:opacity protein-like surface antigen